MRVVLCALTGAALLAGTAPAQDWPQWGRTPQHGGTSPAIAQRAGDVKAALTIDPFSEDRKRRYGYLPVHYPVTLVDGDDVFLMQQSGRWNGTATDARTWGVRSVRITAGGTAERWAVETDWKPVPYASGAGGPAFEPPYQCALTKTSVWAPAAGGTMLKIDRADGSILARINPFGDAVDPAIFCAGPPAVSDAGDVYYTAIRLDPSKPWSDAAAGAWLVRIDPAGHPSVVSFAALVPDAPAPAAQCTSVFAAAQLPFPPSPDAVAPSVPCGSQRPGIGIAPAIAQDGTVYSVSRAHLNSRWGSLVAVRADLTPLWAASLRNRFTDGCNAMLPPNGTPGGCRTAALDGVDPADNQRGSGVVDDSSTASPVVAPDGHILYAADSRYDYGQGHLMAFAPDGTYLGAYPAGHDCTPAIFAHDGTYSIVLKENRYDLGTYCNDPEWCPARNVAAPGDPERYLVTQLDPALRVEWTFENDSEWCVSAVAIDANGTVCVNSEDGYLYEIEQGGRLRGRLFLRLAIDAAYSPVSIDGHGRVYAINDGVLFVAGDAPPRRRSVAH